ncbi:hypothetical protein FKM82_021915 [Ascaphus truei]
MPFSPHLILTMSAEIILTVYMYFQEEVYTSTTKNLIEGVISGYNATVFAYGPTGTGKTYTMLGMDCEPGIYIRTLTDLFHAIEATRENMDYSVSMSYVEVNLLVVSDMLPQLF